MPEYVCPQCGPDSNGGDVHTLTHHTWPIRTVDEAIEELTIDDTELNGDEWGYDEF